MKVIGDLDTCIGAGDCVLIAPDIFEQSGDDGLVRLRLDPIDSDDLRLAREAVDHCPSGALSICGEDQQAS
jgi:ferredoxin